MYFKYGNYTHPDHEVDLVNIKHQRMYSKRNRVVFIRKTLQLQGHICTTGQDALRTAINNLKNAYAEDLQDAVL